VYSDSWLNDCESVPMLLGGQRREITCTLTRKQSEWDRLRRVWCRYPKNDYREHKNYCSESNCVRQDTGGISWLELIYWRQFIWASLPAYDRNNTLNVMYVFAEQEHSIEFIVYVKSFRINTRLLQLSYQHAVSKLWPLCIRQHTCNRAAYLIG
jgi:hypothetical protein